MSAGVRSSEFALHTLSFACGVLFALLGYFDARDVVFCGGALWAAASALGYGHGRSLTKAPRPILPPPPRL